MNYSNILKFKGVWRNYQERILVNTQKYIQDGRIHIVAAPGSGKTTLGIELIGRMGETALVLAPSITIREQWAARIVEGFLCEGLKPEDYISQDLKNPRCITIATYQALHSAMNRYKGKLEEVEVSENSTLDDAVTVSEKDTEEVDYSGFDVVAEMKSAGVGVLCLDECHHLRSEWWKALEEFKEAEGELKVIALTATPPYDSTPALWNRYINMCGEIDEEITIPELVKEGSLCPHQDFVYFNYPTEEETEEVEKFKTRSRKMMEKLMEDPVFLEAIQSHGGLTGAVSDDELLDEPSYLAALLIYLQAKNVLFPSHLQKLLGAKRLPKMETKWMEILLQGFLYDDAEAYEVTKEYREQLIAELKAQGLIEKRKVTMNVNAAIEKLLTNSKGKCRSIQAVVESEYKSSGKNLRMLILTDYIRKEYEKAVGVADSQVNALGVLPFFEQLRRAAQGKSELRLGVLCGTIVIIPAEAKEALEEAVGNSGKINFSSIGSLSENDYLKVTAVGDAHFLTGAVTEVFTKGYMQVLIGTKSLLGEGWDSPCINSLILASFVGSFMLSNQMRGRAIRVFKSQPDKTSNIWHLVCLSPWEETKECEAGSISEDFTLLERRMEHFLGLHYTEDIIENGMERLSIVKPPFHKQNVEVMNQQMLALSGQRSDLKQRWERALSKFHKMDIVEETTVTEDSISKVVFRQSFRKLVAAGIIAAVCLVAAVIFRGNILEKGVGILAIIAAIKGLMELPKVLRLGSAEKRLKAYGDGIRNALLQQQLLESSQSKVVAEVKKPGQQVVYLAGGSGRDKSLFAQCVKELFGKIENQRYLLVKERGHRGEDGFYCVPECFAKRKEDAERFLQCMEPFKGEYQLVYTRSEAGRKVLLEGRVKALANKEDRSSSHKRATDF